MYINSTLGFKGFLYQPSCSISVLHNISMGTGWLVVIKIGEAQMSVLAASSNGLDSSLILCLSS